MPSEIKKEYFYLIQAKTYLEEKIKEFEGFKFLKQAIEIRKMYEVMLTAVNKMLKENYNYES